MSDWEDNDFDDTPVAPVPSVKKSSKWDDEDAEDVKDSWDADSDEEKKSKPVATKPAPGKPAPAKKGTIASAAAAAAKKAAPVADAPVNETPEQRKLRLRQLEQAADFENVKDLFGGLKFTANLGSDEQMDIGTFNPTNKEGFDQLSKAIAASAKRFQSHGLYFSFIESLVRELADSVKEPLDIKRLASDLTAMANERQRLQKEKEGKKKKVSTKKALNRNDDLYDDIRVEGIEGGGDRYDADDFM